MNYKYTKYGFINALWSLIPIFPTLTLFPGVLIAMALENAVNSCETSYLIVLWSSIILAVLSIKLFLLRLDKIEKNSKLNFRLLSLLIYTLINTIGLILIVGVHLVCHGDGQTILACIYSGPVASLLVVVLGLICDLRIKMISDNRGV